MNFLLDPTVKLETPRIPSPLQLHVAAAAKSLQLEVTKRRMSDRFGKEEAKPWL